MSSEIRGEVLGHIVGVIKALDLNAAEWKALSSAEGREVRRDLQQIARDQGPYPAHGYHGRDYAPLWITYLPVDGVLRQGR